jgi:hypothetical protein
LEIKQFSTLGKIILLAVNPDLLNIASISFIILFTEGHLKNRCCIVSSLSLIWQRWQVDLVKYNQSRIGDQTIFNTWKKNFKKHLQCTLQTSHINENDKNKLSSLTQFIDLPQVTENSEPSWFGFPVTLKDNIDRVINSGNLFNCAKPQAACISLILRL